MKPPEFLSWLEIYDTAIPSLESTDREFKILGGLTQNNGVISATGSSASLMLSSLAETWRTAEAVLRIHPGSQAAPAMR